MIIKLIKTVIKRSAGRKRIFYAKDINESYFILKSSTDFLVCYYDYTNSQGQIIL